MPYGLWVENVREWKRKENTKIIMFFFLAQLLVLSRAMVLSRQASEERKREKEDWLVS